jgi:hypothetical protein
VFPIIKKKIKAGQTNFLARRLKSSKQPVSGLRVKVLKGEIEVSNQRHSEIILWGDSSPESVSFGGIKSCM